MWLLRRLAPLLGVAATLAAHQASEHSSAPALTLDSGASPGAPAAPGPPADSLRQLVGSEHSEWATEKVEDSAAAPDQFGRGPSPALPCCLTVLPSGLDVNSTEMARMTAAPPSPAHRQPQADCPIGVGGAGCGRPRRSADALSAAAGGSIVTPDMADTLLKAYDLLAGKNQSVVYLYLANVGELLSGFCVQATADAAALSAGGGQYTNIQLDALQPGAADFNQSALSLAGTEGRTVLLDSAFASAYASWRCANGSVTCSELCLASSQVKAQIFQDNFDMASYFAFPAYSGDSLARLVSDLFSVQFLDPVLGTEVTLASNLHFTVRIPLLNFTSALYYKCFVFSGDWDDQGCSSADYADKTADGDFELECVCRKSGYIGVFWVTPPTPLLYSPYRAFQLTFGLSANASCSADEAEQFAQSLAQAAGLDSSRFVNTSNCSAEATLRTFMRPALGNETSNSYALQAIKRVVYMPGGFGAFGNATVISMTEQEVHRDLRNDGNARRVTLKMDKSYKTVVGDSGAQLGASWLRSLADAMHISEARFKKPTLQMGILFNFTVTLPFAGEPSEERALSAEELALWLQEQSRQGLVRLLDARGERMPVEPIADADIFQLVVAQRWSTLLIVLSAAVGAVCALGALCVAGLVLVKVKTDRLIEKHNAEVRGLAEEEQVATLRPAEAEPVRLTAFGQAEERQLDLASDTVVFRRNR